MAQGMNQESDLVNTVLKFQVPQNPGNFLSS
jgi:hypothetical protein